jgi:hypothetical protein
LKPPVSSFDPWEALTRGLKLVSLDPLREHVHRALMRLYAAQGHHNAALAQYERCRRELTSELGVQPEPETEELARSIRASRRSDSTRLQDGREGLPLLDKPSIAVLPFENMSGDPEQEYCADGMVEEIITALSRFRQLFVIARNSSFTYKGRAVDVKQVGRELRVRYVLEGSCGGRETVCVSPGGSSTPQLVRICGQTGSTEGSRTSSICRIK